MELTDADVLDTIEYFVHEDRRASAAAQTPQSHWPTPNTDANTTATYEEEKEEEVNDTRASPGSSSSSSYKDDTLTETHELTSVNANSQGDSGVPKSRQKQELEYLKAKVRELERELRRVEQANDERLVEVGDSLWQRVAQQQSIECQKSLSKNAKLKEQLEAQVKFSKSLEKIIRKRPSLVAFGGNSGNRASPTAFQRRKRKPVATNLYEELMAGAAREYERIGEVMHAMQVHEILTDHRSVNIRVCKTKAQLLLDGSSSSTSVDANALPPATIRVETIEVRRFPFPFHSVAREWWKFISQASQLEQLVEGLSRKVESTSDAHFATTSMQFPVGDQVGVLSARAAIRRFHEEDRTAVTYVSHGDCGAKKNPKSMFSVIEKGWIIVKPLPGSPGSSILQSVGHFTPSLRDPESASYDDFDLSDSDEKQTANERSVEAGILTEVIFNAYQKTASYIYSVIENALMEEHLQQQQQQQGGGRTGELKADEESSLLAGAADKRPPATF